jgi:hypothetical protein
MKYPGYSSLICRIIAIPGLGGESPTEKRFSGKALGGGFIEPIFSGDNSRVFGVLPQGMGMRCKSSLLEVG